VIAIVSGKSVVEPVGRLDPATNVWEPVSIGGMSQPTTISLQTDAAYVGNNVGKVAWGDLSGDMEGPLPLDKSGTLVVTALQPWSGAFFVGTTHGAFCVNTGAKPMPEPVGPSGELDDRHHISSTGLAEAGGVLYISAEDSATADCGVIEWDPIAQTWGVLGVSSGLPSNNATTLAVLGDTLFAGTDSGLAAMTVGNGSFSPIDLESGDPPAQPYVNALHVDRGVVYAGTSAGLWYSPDGGTVWMLLEPGAGLPASLPSASVLSVATLGNRVLLAIQDFGVLELAWQ
jgi:hypothetical protein